jgi:hypothetical protein
MELNHQIRLCRPFPFRFGFRAISHNIGNRTSTTKRSSSPFVAITTSHDPPRPSFIKSPPPRESMNMFR